MKPVSMVKIEIFIPCSHFEALREALQKAGAGSMGNYDGALSYSMVKGCWRPLSGANPYDGEIGVLKEADEYKVEVCCEASAAERTVKAIRAVHPYEMPVINVIPLITV
jgi:hypothetical protein